MEYKRVNKKRARNIVSKGGSVFLLPNNTRTDSMFITPVELTQSLLDKHGSTFDKFVNEFEFYNCVSELGRYASYYVLE